MSNITNILSNLNPSQRAAVASSAQTLAILAGPGSGKTHTLTSRTAWLMKHEGIQPWNIIVATFTVKAAREMKERIGKLIGDGTESKLILGTFHSVARRYLARYGHLIDIPRDFGIADSSDSLAMIKRIVKRHKLTIDPPVARSRISCRKAMGDQAREQSRNRHSAEKQLETQEFETCYTEYENALKRSNLLDYDDLLLRCVELLRAYPSCVSNVEAVLIDEFQDTSIVQFDLMRLFAAERRNVTIVGDPDQSIYGFRSAETQNFKRMLVQYPETVTIPLEENYRSSGCILSTALEVIQQDVGRISKSLMPTHAIGTQPVLRRLSSAHSEAQWIITEIRRLTVLTGNLMTFNDIAILVRSASLSRHIESALGKGGIPYRMVGGLRFFDRSEIKILLDYLRVINLPNNNDALARVVNVPSRRIGDTTVKSLLEEAEKTGSTLWKLILENVQGVRTTKTKLSKQTEQGLSSFANIILSARKKVSDLNGSQLSIKELIEFVISKLSFEDYLERTHSEDHESRWANVQELINQASDFAESTKDGHDEEALPEVAGLQQDGLSNPLSKFLANIALASAVEVSELNGAPQIEITISTIHAAKGLEWPVVFIPATYEGSIPHSRAEDDDEERRLLYVAMTRAKALLYMSYPCKNSQREQTTLSPFLTPLSIKLHLSERGPSFSCIVTQSIAEILGRPVPIIDIGAASCILESIEDDMFAIEGEDGPANGSKLDGWDGDHHYTQGQQPPKRQRIATKGAYISAQQAWRPSYAITMTQSASFSSASATFSNKFVSAGAYIIESNDMDKSSDTGTKFDSNKDKGSKSVNSRTRRRLEGQGTLTSFFSTSATSITPNAAMEQVPKHLSAVPSHETRPFIQQKKSCNYVPMPLPQMHSAPTQTNHGVPLSLKDHRLGSGQLSAPARNQQDEEGTKNKHYIFLSSSPQRQESFIGEVDEPIPFHPSDLAPVSSEGATNMGRMQPTKTMHVTSMAKLSAIVPRKTLGVRRSLAGWSNRNGPFAPPTMHGQP